jgi:hypothetical protein
MHEALDRCGAGAGRMLVNAPAATAGGSALEKIKPDPKLRTKSQIVAELVI